MAARFLGLFLPTARRIVAFSEKKPINLENSAGSVPPGYDIPPTLKIIHGDGLMEGYGGKMMPPTRSHPIPEPPTNPILEGYDFPPTLRIIHGEGDIF